MKKSLLALAVAAVAASTAASAATVYDKDGTSLDVYGRVQGVVYSTHQANYNSYGDASLQATGRLGFNMRTNLTAGIDGFANMEWDVADKTDTFKARYAYLGADFGAFGVVKAGRFEDAVKYVIGATDIFDDFGCAGQFGNDDKLDGIVMYSWSGYGFDVNVSAQTAQNDQHVDGLYRNSEEIDVNASYAASLGYTSPAVLFGPISVKAGYSFIETQSDEEGFSARGQAAVKDIQTWAASASWGNLSEGLYLAAMYDARTFSSANNGSDTDAYGVEAVAGYAFQNGVSVRTGWNYQNWDDGAVELEANTVPVYVNYQVNPLFNVWTEARFDVGCSEGQKSNFDRTAGTNYAENVYSVGARYTF